MAKCDELLKELENNMSEYIKSIGKFQHENHNFALTNHYFSDEYLACEVCGHERIIEVFVITDESGKNLNCGNVCIEKLTNMKIKERYESWQRKKDNITKNCVAINYLTEVLNAIEIDELPIWISRQGVQRLTAMYERMCNGLDPLKTQWRLYYSYKKRLDNEGFGKKT